MSSPVVDIFLVYQFLKRLTTPFDQTDAFRLGLIDENGVRLKKASTSAEKLAMGYFDRMIFNLKRLLNKIPGGKTRIASYAAALLLLRETQYGKTYAQGIELEKLLHESILVIDIQEYKRIIEDAPVNMTGAAVVGTGDNTASWRNKPKGRPKENQIDGDSFLRRKTKTPESKVYYRSLGKYVKPSKSSSSGGDE